MRSVGTYSPGIAAIPDIAALLGVSKVENLWVRPTASVDHVLVWGRKPRSRVARVLARMRNRSIVQLEDGFLRSVGLGVSGARPLSVVVDPSGIYYDATRPSRLENLLAGTDAQACMLDEPCALDRARALVRRIRETGVSKYNGGVETTGLSPPTRRRVLVVDQTDRDLSLRLGGAMPGGLGLLTSAALDEHPDAEIVVKIHPDVISGRKRGHEDEVPSDPRVTIVSRWVHPAALLRDVEDVYVMTSQLGFDALLHGHRVHCFGAPFYAGWGLTNDRVAIARRGVGRSIEQLTLAALVLYPRYVDPETGARCEVERVVEILAAHRRAAGAFAYAGPASGIERRIPSPFSIRAAG